MASSSIIYDVFISHAIEDKFTIALPLQDMLLKHGIRAFVDKEDMGGDTHSITAVTEAMKTAAVAVVVLSPEFIAREWPMKELLCFLRRNEQPLDDELPLSTIIPLFYRLSITELDREPQIDGLDVNGKRLYAKSRFFERQKRGEPEADVTNIKTVLQKLRVFMGIENHSKASNENSSEMNKRRGDLLNRLCEDIRGALKCKTDKFRCHYHKEKDKILSGLVLDFDGCDEEGNATPIEAEVLKVVLDTSENTDVISLQGIGGVGKSSILQGLSNLDVVKQRYKDGIHLISLGADATRTCLIKSLCRVVRDAGGSEKADEMIKLENYRDVFAAFESWFSGKHCLFMLDNIWETAEISLAIIEEFVTLDLFVSNSKLLFTTRRTDIACEAEKRLVVQTREPLSSQCRKILLLYADIDVDNRNEADSRAVREILTKCSGLPLFLKIAGKTVKAENDKFLNNGCLAYRHYAAKLHARLQQFLKTPVGSYERLSSTLDISVQLVEDLKDAWGFGSHVSAAQMYRRLSTLLRQSNVPMSTLKNLWELDSKDEATMAAKEFERVGLATLEIEDEASNHADMLSLHDSLHRYAVVQTEKHDEKELGHSVLIACYGRRLETERDCRAWWSMQLEADGYVHRHLWRHLVLAGLEEELLTLLLRPEWTIRCFVECGILDLERNYRLGEIAVKKIEEEQHEGQSHRGRVWAIEKEMALQMVTEAIRLSCGFRLRHPRELCFQLYGRLRFCAEENVFINGYLGLLYSVATKLGGPWMRGLSPDPVLTPPSSPNTRSRQVGSAVVCMALSDDGDCAFCGCRDGVVIVVDSRSLEIVNQWFISYERTRKIMFSDDRRFIFSESKDRSVKVWETQTGVLRLTLVNSKDLTCAAVTTDGRLITAGWNDGTVRMHVLESGEELLAPFNMHDGRILCMAALPDGEHFVSGGEDKTLRIWSADTGEQVGEALVGHEDWVTCVSVIPRERRVVSGSIDGTVRIWDIGKRSQVAREGCGRIACMAIGADGKRVVYGTVENTVGVWNVPSGDKTSGKLGHTDSVTGVILHPDGNSIISCSSDGTIRVSEIARMRSAQSLMNRTVNGLSCGVSDAVFTSDHRYLVAQRTDFDLTIYDANSGERFGRSLSGNRQQVKWGIVIPDNRWVVTVYGNRVVGFWKLDSRTHLFWKICRDIGFGAVEMSDDSCYATHFDSEESISLIVTKSPYHADMLRGYHGSTKTDIVIMICEWRNLSIPADVRVHNLKTGQTMGGRTGRFSLSGCMFIDRQMSQIYREKTASPVFLRGRDVWYVRGEERLLLGTLETRVQYLALASNGKTIWIRGKDGNPASMRLEPWYL